MSWKECSSYIQVPGLLDPVPSTWQVKPLRHVATSVESGTSVNAVDRPAEAGEVGVLKTSCVYSGEFNPMENKAVVPDEVKLVSCPVARNRLIVSRMNTPDLVGAAGLVQREVESIYLPDRLWQVSFTNDVEPAFIHYWTHTSSYRSQVNLACSGTSSSMKNLSQDQFRSFVLAIPELDEQRAIVRFLKNEVARVDHLIAKQERLIELLQEKRQALITRAVTKGLDPTVPMKNSGVAWLGEVPDHWCVVPTRSIARLESGHTPSRQHPEYWENCTIPWFSLADVGEIRDGAVEYVHRTVEKVSELGIENSAARVLPAGTVLLSRTASVGYSAIMAVPMATTQDFVNWVPSKDINSAFLLYVFRAMKPEFDRLRMGSTHQTIYMPDVRTFRCPFPPLEEQAQIVEYVRSELVKIDELSSLSKRLVERTKEHRYALISAAVAGKIRVIETEQFSHDSA